MFFYFLVSVVITVSAANALPPPTPKPCEQACTLDYTPICAAPTGATKSSDKKSFGNSCVLSNYNCQNNASKYRNRKCLCD